MNKKQKELSLIDALSFCSLRELPEEDDKKNIWIRALADVQKFDGSESYVVLKKSVTTLQNNIVKDFGSLSSIYKVNHIYPYDFLKAKYMPTFKTNKREDKIKYLNNHISVYTGKRFEDMTAKELEKEIIKVAIKTQLYHEKQQE